MALKKLPLHCFTRLHFLKCQFPSVLIFRWRIFESGRACAMAGDTAKGKRVPRLPHTLEDADPDLPILKQAKAEYEKLQSQLTLSSNTGHHWSGWDRIPVGSGTTRKWILCTSWKKMTDGKWP